MRRLERLVASQDLKLVGGGPVTRVAPFGEVVGINRGGNRQPLKVIRVLNVNYESSLVDLREGTLEIKRVNI